MIERLYGFAKTLEEKEYWNRMVMTKTVNGPEMNDVTGSSDSEESELSNTTWPDLELKEFYARTSPRMVFQLSKAFFYFDQEKSTALKTLKVIL